jgi:paraquat-inducible protein B
VAKKPSATLVGAFTLLGGVLVLASVIIWGSGRLFEHRYRYVCYFPGAVNGLNVGAVVRYRGVPVGQVSNIQIRYQQPPDDLRIPVFVELNEKRVRELGVVDQPISKIIPLMVQKGLRARLEPQSLLTGQLAVSLDLFPDTPIQLVHREPGYPEIPTIPTPLEEAEKSLSGLVAQLGKTDFAGMARSLNATIEGINHLVNTPSIARTLREMPSTVASIRQLVANTDAGVARLGQLIQSTLAARGPVIGDFQRALVDVQRAADAVRRLAELLERNPNALIVGKKRQ